MAFNIEMSRYFANKMWRKNKDTFVSKETGKSLSTNDYTNEDKNKLDNLSAETTTYDNTTSGLSATNVQGAIDEINNELSGKSDSTHNHDDSYYTKTEINSKLSDLPTGAETTSCDMSIFGKKVEKIDYECDASDTFHDLVEAETPFLPYAFYCSDAVVYNNEIHILGGENSKTKHYKYDGVSWTEASTLPYEFYNGSAVVYNNEIHILGGSSSDSTYTKHYKYDGTNWMEVGTLPYEFYGSSAVVYNNEIHILGGDDYSGSSSNGKNLTKHYKYDGTSWTEVSTLPYEFYGSSAVVYNNEIHILGSGNNETKHYKYDGASWTEVSTLPYNFNFGSAVVYNNEIHILGGMRDWHSSIPGHPGFSDTTSDNNETKHYKYDGTSWTEASTLPYEFSSGSAVVYNNEIHILGGESGDSMQHGIYIGNRWLYLKNLLPYEFYRGSAVVYNNEIHILGGDNNYAAETKHYKWNGTYWTEASTLPYEFNRSSAVVYNNEIHILGSCNSNSNNKTKHYKYDGTNWIEASTLPYEFYNSGAVVYNNEIHIFGGGKNLTKHYKWNGTSWAEVSTLPYEFYGSDAVVYNNEIHILGSGKEGNETKHYKYDGTSWTEVSTLPYKFDYGNAVVYNNEIHILGGWNNYAAKTKHYKWNGTNWIETSTLPYTFYGGSAVVLQGLAFIIGGDNNLDKFFESDLDYNTLRVKSVYYQ